MRNWLLSISIILLLNACDGKSDDPQPAPFQAALVQPAKNNVCTPSILLSATESKVLFMWHIAKHAESYELTIKNLLNNESTTHNATDTLLELTLLRNTPYSWYVVSKTSKGPERVKSEVWKFYNPGQGAVWYAPYPAEIVSPLMAQQISFGTGKIKLDWNGNDADSDISGYDVYFGPSNTPPLLSSGLTNSELSNVTVTANSKYYWKVITKDTKGNTSDSGIYEFEVR